MKSELQPGGTPETELSDEARAAFERNKKRVDKAGKKSGKKEPPPPRIRYDIITGLPS